MTTTVRLWVELKAKEGKEDEVQAFLESDAALVAEEPGTTVDILADKLPG
jgi:hypothetical protein